MYVCDDKCPMFKGYSICAHVVAAAEDNGDLKSFLDCVRCRPNLTAIGNAGMPSGSGRKGGKAKHKRNRSIIPIETRSVRPCLVQSSSSSKGTDSLTLSTPTENQQGLQSPGSSGQLSIHQPYTHRYSRAPLVTTSVPKTLSATGVITASPSSSPQVCVSSAVASTSGQVLVGGSGSVFNVSPPTCAIPTTLPMPAISVQLQSTPTIAAATSGSSSVAQVNPFILKFKTNLIKVCQSCRNNYEGLNDTMGLVVA